MTSLPVQSARVKPPAEKPAEAPRCVATVRDRVVGWADTVEDLLAELQFVFEPGCDHDCVLWERGSVRAVLTSEGQTVWVARLALLPGT